MEEVTMKLDAKALAWSTGLVFLGLYAICAFFAAYGPAATMAFFSTVNHLDMSGLSWNLTWGSFIAGAAFWFVLPAATAGALASIYNMLAGRHAVSKEHVGTRAPK
jgi:hypothetical protein